MTSTPPSPARPAPRRSAILLVVTALLSAHAFGLLQNEPAAASVRAVSGPGLALTGGGSLHDPDPDPDPGSSSRPPSGPDEVAEGDAEDPSASPYARGLAASTVGQLGARDYGCTATVVAAESGSVALTAAHCVYVPTERVLIGGVADRYDPGWLSEQLFYPGRVGDEAPYGIWTVEQMWVDPRWQDTGDPRWDVAFLRIAEQDGRTIADVVGAQGLWFGTDAGPEMTALGYPSFDPFDGTTLRRCQTDTAHAPEFWIGTVAMSCAMTEGSSGGPWLMEFDEQAGAGRVAAVTSVLPLDDSGELYATVLDEFARDLYRAADNAPAVAN